MFISLQTFNKDQLGNFGRLVLTEFSATEMTSFGHWDRLINSNDFEEQAAVGQLGQICNMDMGGGGWQRFGFTLIEQLVLLAGLARLLENRTERDLTYLVFRE